MEPSYPTCSTCGHNASAVVVGRCTVYVPWNNGPGDFGMDYCDCRCVDDPTVKAWLEGAKAQLPDA